MTIKVGGTPSASSSNLNYYKPNSSGNNFIVVLNEPDVDWVWSDELVKMFKQNKFGNSYPINATWAYLGKGNGDPKDVLAPELKLGFGALIPIAYQDGKEWKFGLWQIQSIPLFNALSTLESTNGVVGKVVNAVLSGKNWTVMPAGKMVPPSEEALDSFRKESPDVEIIKKLVGHFDDADSIYEMILTRNGLNNREELFSLFDVESELM